MNTLQSPPRRFDLRVSAIIPVGDRLLVNEAHDERLGGVWHACFGGRLEWGERAADCLARELREELGLAVDIGPPVYLHEYRYQDGDVPVHEVGLYFLIAAQALSAVTAREPGLHPVVVDLETLSRTLYPEVLREHLLRDLRVGFPPLVRHLVSGDFGGAV